ncbi:hypothetical protein SUGI_0374950 [Cryptomeria japonica]|uniref:cationic peroxidase 2-like n=1 Tax=Cryptomeria japonica TaxID=3369 RepID=UPI002408D916|nr:cationic peroxidase 2-like [Cryptomeria japonica]GLJ20587.1 hypothetical protein SUGI_0374950 [Cryptomeria japonica]
MAQGLRIIILFVYFLFSVKGEGSTRVGFYSKTCPTAEKIVRSTVESHVNANVGIAAGLLRLHFHDCFVQGCDGSVLISGHLSERTAIPNLGARGFEVIEDAKAKIEAKCPGVVSCADILAIAARDSVVLTKGMSWSVPTGRRDGLISSASEVLTNLPSPADSVSVQKDKFAAKGLTTEDLVTLVGGHTIGQTDCQFFRYRLYNFTSTGNADPSINMAFVSELQSLCPAGGDATKRVALDNGSQNNFDASFFKNIRDGKGVLESDQRLWSDPSTNIFVQKYAGSIRGFIGFRFGSAFGKAMVKMGNIGIKTGTDGEIRKVCSRFNA